jgi:hypothetical protein
VPTPTHTPTLDRPADAVPATLSGCDACPHPVSGHDAIGLRFCRATLDSALARGCVCPPA